MSDQNIKCLLVDDEPPAIALMQQYVGMVDQLELVDSVYSAIKAFDILKDTHIDLMFLDIQMPQLTGTDFLKTLSNPPLVIFTTAYANYAIEGFELNAIDYLLKPISLERFMKAVNKAVEQIELQRKDNAATITASDDPNFIFVKADKKLIKVSYDDIIYIEGLKDYVIIRQDTGRIITLQTMKSLEEKLPKGIFKRIHRSYIVNMNKINAVVGNMIEVKEKGQAKHLPVGKNYRDDLLNIINKNRL